MERADFSACCITELHRETFSYCAGLTGLRLPDTLKTFGSPSANYSPVENCRTFETLVIPAGVTTFYPNSFQYSGLKYLVFQGHAPAQWGQPLFTNFNSNTLNIFTPDGDASWNEDIKAEFCNGRNLKIHWRKLSELTGWQKNGDYWMYFDGSGYMQTGWLWIDGKWYLFDYSGHMQTGWEYIGDHWFRFDNSGVMQVDWQWIDGCWYYFDDFGHMQTGWQCIDYIWFYLDGSGHMQTGWQWVDGHWYLFDGSGHMQTSWQWIDGSWYYFNGSGHLIETA